MSWNPAVHRTESLAHARKLEPTDRRVKPAAEYAAEILDVELPILRRGQRISVTEIRDAHERWYLATIWIADIMIPAVMAFFILKLESDMIIQFIPLIVIVFLYKAAPLFLWRL